MKRVFDLLKKTEVMTLATSSDDKPRASILSQYVTENGSIIFGTDPNSIKGVNIQKNKRISFSVFNAPEYVTIDGVVAVPTEEEKAGYLKQLFANHPEMEEYLNKGAFTTEFYKIIPETVYYSDMSNGSLGPEIINPDFVS